MLGVASFAAIVIIAYAFGYLIKVSPLDDKYIPVCCGLIGLILGVVAYYVGVPDFPASDPLTAAAVGVVSGFAATGIDQTITQLKDN